jgi:Arc/MetJ family transcription regulator
VLGQGICLAYADGMGKIVCMRTTLNLDDDLVARAMSATHASTKTAAIEMGLRELLAKAARERLASLYGSDPGAKAPARRRLDRRS